ncbi:MAG: hypothetical protein SO255_03980 [Sodaliphilus sp.]|nr:hypothetical protein [Sodaliphilus sp.]
MLPNREWNKKQKHKKQPWSNVECFAFGVAKRLFFMFLFQSPSISPLNLTYSSSSVVPGT